MDQSAGLAWLTTICPDGAPHVTPVWFVESGGDFWVGTARSNVKVRNVERDGRVALAFIGSAGSPNVAEGTASIVAVSSGAQEVRDAFAAKYEGWDVSDESVDGPRVLIRIVVRKWMQLS